MSQKTNVKNKVPSWRIQINSMQLTPQICKYVSQVQAVTLEEAYKIAQEKKQKLQEMNPQQNNFVIAEVKIV